MKKFIIFALGLLVFLFIGRQVLVPKMVERGFARMISANVGVDRTADLSDGLHVTFAAQALRFQTLSVAGLALLF